LVKAWPLQQTLVHNSRSFHSSTSQVQHIERSDFLTSMHHRNWRSHTVEKLSVFSENDLHLTAVCTLSTEDFQKVRQILKQSMDQCRDVVSPSSAECGAALTIDWFKI
jgi:hypothetical protein